MDIPIRRRLDRAQAMNPLFLDTARLLIQTAPLVFIRDTFALKGGMAINPFLA